jgi:hypothetical protein
VSKCGSAIFADAWMSNAALPRGLTDGLVFTSVYNNGLISLTLLTLAKQLKEVCISF